MKQIIYYLLLLLFIIQSGCNRPSEIQKIDGMPPIYPDYTNITIPYNIAPLNFLLRNMPQSVEVSVKGKIHPLLYTEMKRYNSPKGNGDHYWSPKKGMI